MFIPLGTRNLAFLNPGNYGDKHNISFRVCVCVWVGGRIVNLQFNSIYDTFNFETCTVRKSFLNKFCLYHRKKPKQNLSTMHTIHGMGIKRCSSQYRLYCSFIFKPVPINFQCSYTANNRNTKNETNVPYTCLWLTNTPASKSLSTTFYIVL